jgi:CP family cyanate transporter-like MFS transporter
MVATAPAEPTDPAVDRATAQPRTSPVHGRGLDPALLVILGGVVAALHVGKLAPAIATLQQSLGVTLVQAGFLLSLVQLAGMSLGVAFGVLADGLGLKRSMVLGLALLALVSAAGGVVSSVPALMALRAAEGFGFLLVVLPAPGLVRRLVAPGRLNVMLGLWGAYMPLATALALLLGPLLIAALGWRAWWWTLAALSLAMALWLARSVPATPPPSPSASAAGGLALAWTTRLARTLAAPGPWLVALTFALYSGQWLAVVGFLPVIYTAAGLSAAATGVLTALAAGVNMVGNIAAGRLLHRGWPAPRLLRLGFVVMGLAAALTFAGAAGAGAPPWLRYGAVLAFSMCGGLIPGTLFALAVRLAPGEAMLGSTVGWVQQWSAFGQFAGPPAVAWLASGVGGWQFTWIVTGACSLLGLALSVPIARRVRR